MSNLKAGDKIKLENAAAPYAEVLRVLGEGGQGTVYEVSVGVEVTFSNISGIIREKSL
jgi:hypothetical protein